MSISNIWRFDLIRGNSKSPRDGACLLDAVSWFNYGHLDDYPPCVCPVLAAYGRRLNDFLPNDQRQKLKVFLPRLVGTVDKPNAIVRAEYAVRRTIREVLPVVLRAQGLEDFATQCETLDGSMVEYRELCLKVANPNGVVSIDAGTTAYAAYTAAAYAAYTASPATCAAYAIYAAAYAAYTATTAYAIYAASPDAINISEIAITIFAGMLEIGLRTETSTEDWMVAADRFAEARALDPREINYSYAPYERKFCV